MFKEFKKFAFRGNVLDMAVGVIVGAAFSTIVNSLVNDIIMPLISLITGGVDITGLKLVLSAAQFDEAGAVIKEAVTLNYGTFLQDILNFLIVAFSLFLVVKAINRLRDAAFKKEEAAPAEPPKKPDDVALLEEIRDLMKDKK